MKDAVFFSKGISAQENPFTFEQLAQRETLPMEEIYWSFRKGEYGLMLPHFEILVLVLALLFSGHLIAYRGKNRRGPDELVRSGLKGITGLGKGEILGETGKLKSLNQFIENSPTSIPFHITYYQDLKMLSNCLYVRVSDLKCSRFMTWH